MKTFYIIGWQGADIAVGLAKVIDCFSTNSVEAARRQLRECAAQNKGRANYHHFQLVEQKAMALV